VAANNRLGSIQETFADTAEEEEEEQEEEDEQQEQGEEEVATPLTEEQAAAEEGGPKKKRKRELIKEAKKELLEELNRHGGDVDMNTPSFQSAFHKLMEQYDASKFDPRALPTLGVNSKLQLEGTAISAGKTKFPGCIGRNDQGDPMYKLGSMSFDMFCPTQLVVSVQGSFVIMDSVNGKSEKDVKNVPSALLADVREGINPVRSYE